MYVITDLINKSYMCSSKTYEISIKCYFIAQ